MVQCEWKFKKKHCVYKIQNSIVGETYLIKNFGF